MKTVSAAVAKAKLLGLLETVRRTGEDVVITKRGRPVARLAPLSTKHPPLKARARIKGDVLSPVEERWFE